MIADPGELERAAARLDEDAVRLDDTARQLEQAASGASWQCAAADRWHSAAADERRLMQLNASRLHALAQMLRRAATRLDHELQELERIEQAVTGWLSGLVPAGIIPPWAGLPWGLGNLPPTGDPRWGGMVFEARRRGAPV